MADVLDDATLLDPGRRRSPVAGPTELDPGRRRPAVPDPTVLDPGRTRPPDGERPFGAALPPLLDARFTVVRVIHQAAADPARGEGDVYLVRERTGGDERVLKLCRDAGPDPRVGAFLARRRSRHLVQLHDSGTEEGRDYQVMEHLVGGSLADLLRQYPDGMDAPTVTVVVEQLAEALGALHGEGLVHRDVKPDNVLVRSLDPFEVALIDFGLATYAPDQEMVSDSSGTLRYMPPEFMSGGLLSAAYDWWSLGACARELATGRPLLDGLDDANVRIQVSTGPLRLDDLVNDRIRLLCQGLLAPDPGERWGAAEIERWRAGETPDVAAAFGAPRAEGATGSADAAQSAAEAGDPFEYQGTEYRDRALLAAALTATWQTAAHLLFRGDGDTRERLAQWLARRRGTGDGWRDDPRQPPDVRLLFLLRWMAPTHPPLYRGVSIARGTLPRLATDALDGEGNAPSIVDDLYRYSLLPHLALGAGAAGLESGEGLDEVHDRWREERRRWDAAVASLADPDALAVLRAGDAEARRRRTRALCLRAAVASTAERDRIHRDLARTARTVNLPWFSALVESRDGMWVAFLLRDHARDRYRVEARRRAWLLRNDRYREWLRRQNRPLALGWAVAGMALLGVLCALFVSVGDIAGRASDAAILDAWVATVFALAAALGCEAALAWEIGGRFHPRYSMLGAGFIALGRAARSALRRGMALAVVVAVLGAAYGLAVFAPVAVPLAAGAGALLWTARRHLSWSADQEREQAEIERGRRERRAAAAGAAALPGG